jgi:methylated-DNA-[protein]-cysteine S-methyltransferase
MGTLVAVATDAGLVSVGWDMEPLANARQVPRPPLEAFEVWWKMYLAKRFDALPEVPLDPRGTPFELQVWTALRSIRPGHTTTYGDIAEGLGRPTGARAVGTAVGHNPLAIIVPCHRVIGANGSLTGYAGGVSRKAWLLRHEGVLLF